MQPAEYDRMAEVEERHWWFRGRLAVVESMLRRYVRPQGMGLDCSCGTGMTLRRLSQYVQIGADLSHLALAHCRRAGMDRLVRSDLATLAMADARLDLVTSLDTLEHVPDDGAALGQIFRVLKPGGHALFTVPAHPFMFSAHDRALHHVRRYRRAELREKIQSAGFRILRLSYINCALFPPVALVRLIQRDKGEVGSDTETVPPAPVNALLRWIFASERFLLRVVNLPMGVSLLAVVQKPS